MALSRHIAALILALALLPAPAPALAQGDPLAGNHAPLPGPQWHGQEARGVSLAVPKNWYGLFLRGPQALLWLVGPQNRPRSTLKWNSPCFSSTRCPNPACPNRVRTTALGQCHYGWTAPPWPLNKWNWKAPPTPGGGSSSSSKSPCPAEAGSGPWPTATASCGRPTSPLSRPSLTPCALSRSFSCWGPSGASWSGGACTYPCPGPGKQAA